MSFLFFREFWNNKLNFLVSDTAALLLHTDIWLEPSKDKISQLILDNPVTRIRETHKFDQVRMIKRQCVLAVCIVLNPDSTR